MTFERVIVTSTDREWREPVAALLATRAVAVETADDVFDAVARARRGAALVLLHAVSDDDEALVQRGLRGAEGVEVVRVVDAEASAVADPGSLVFAGRLVAFVDAVEARARAPGDARSVRGARARLDAARAQSYHAILGVRVGCEASEVAEALAAALADVEASEERDGSEAVAQMRALLAEASDVLTNPATRALYELGLSGR